MRMTEKQYSEYIKNHKLQRKLPPVSNTVKTAEGINEMMIGKNEKNGLIAEFTIPLAPVTKKNHSRVVSFGERCPVCKKGKITKVLPSKQYEKYERDIRKYLTELHREIGTVDFPINLKCVFYSATRRQSDLAGHLQSIQDLLVKYKCLKDDCRDIVASTDGSTVLYDKENPRTEITITRKENYVQWATEKRKDR